ncbi:DUF3303 family protein [Synechococcus sp. A15-24]|uniref:DUF3303 family protein n=1 Tax=Synechococcus sp. A15-24 TaxID=1050635 RepID=UPI0016447722|nr:DUF3303 family protein [Synechococcus sp. A15-24]QNJ30004.1 hypothetical protein SynA1524_02332 [Synechococcus sp. A15-24]
MRFVINWSTPNAGMDPEYTKAVVDYINNGTPMDEFEGFKVLERVFFPQEGGGSRLWKPTACGTFTNSPDPGPKPLESPWK